MAHFFCTRMSRYIILFKELLTQTHFPLLENFHLLHCEDGIRGFKFDLVFDQITIPMQMVEQIDHPNMLDRTLMLSEFNDLSLKHKLMMYRHIIATILDRAQEGMTLDYNTMSDFDLPDNGEMDTIDELYKALADKLVTYTEHTSPM